MEVKNLTITIKNYFYVYIWNCGGVEDYTQDSVVVVVVVWITGYK